MKMRLFFKILKKETQVGRSQQHYQGSAETFLKSTKIIDIGLVSIDKFARKDVP